ncbi:MAG: carboxypeptidase M32 [Parachlamydiaceae bacterium]
MTNQAQQHYKNLHEQGIYIRTLTGIHQLLEWDQETYMPSGAADARSAQIEMLSGIIHEAQTGRKFTQSLGKLIDLTKGTIKVKSLSTDQKIALKEWRRDYLKEKVLPKKFVTELAKLTSQSLQSWREAKQNNTFHTFAPFLKKLIVMKRKQADLLGYKDHPYDALLDLYEPGATTKEVEKVFSPLKKSINSLLKRIGAAKQIDDSFLHGKFPSDKQIEFSKKLLLDMGFNFAHGRLDFSTHPFSSALHPTDSRITTRIHPTSIINCVSTVLHEAGHSLYEMGLPQEQYGSPLGQAISLGVHESQSRWWETRIGQSKPFWQHYLPLLKKTFPGKLDNISLEDFYRAVNKVEPSFIRVDADEVTYPLHVILRFELERALIEGSVDVDDIPKAWNGKMKELLGITPTKDSEGCLQDVHWAMGGFGYFPTYTLGNLYAAHLFEGFEKSHPNWKERLAKGELLFITQWLEKNIHRHGRRYSSQELLKVATGKEFSAAAYTRYLEEKYTEVYRMK